MRYTPCLMDTLTRIEKKRLTREAIKERLYRRRYLVPNAVTVGNMFCGFLAIMYAATGRFENAVIAIFLAILLDGLDGRMARRLNATSKFGVEFDSFSDLISFGVAPAVMMYHWAFHATADKFGVWVTFIYAVCAAGRLARFNIAQENLKSFTGLPSPGAAAAVAAVVYFKPLVEPSFQLVIIGAAVMVSLGYLMVSRIEFISVKMFKISGARRVTAWVTIAALIALVYADPKTGLLAITVLYALSGPIGLLRKKKKVEEAGQKVPS